MRTKTTAVLLALVCLGSVAFGQQTVSVGTALKYAGGRISAEEVTRAQEFLSDLEIHLAEGFAKSSAIDYMDRGNLDEIFKELRLGSGNEFDPATGALRGLLGRLDYLIIVEGTGRSNARVRVIDVETGAVKAATRCEAHSSILGLGSPGTKECVSYLIERTTALAKDRLRVKRERAQKARDEEQAIQKQLAEKERRRAAEQKLAEIKTMEAREQAERDRFERERAQLRNQEEISRIEPRYDDVRSRISAEDSFWSGLDAHLRSSGLSLRPEIRSLMSRIHAGAKRCRSLLADKKPLELETCITELNVQLDVLDGFK